MWLPRQSGSRKENQMEEPKKKPQATPQHLPKQHKPADCELMPCPKCGSTATRFVSQHRCDKKEPGYDGVVTLEVPAYVCEKDSKKSPYKWKCPVCKTKDLDVVLIKCGECGRTAKVA